jgi:putative FmdB family regulatory protein
MPTYQYRCTECGHDLEAVQKFTDAALTECPTCGGTLRKIYNAVGVVFKGSGFYRTDSRKAESSAEGNGNGKVETKSDSKDAGTNGSGSGAADKPTKRDPSPASSPAPAAASSGSSSTGTAGAKKAS